MTYSHPKQSFVIRGRPRRRTDGLRADLVKLFLPGERLVKSRARTLFENWGHTVRQRLKLWQTAAPNDHAAAVHTNPAFNPHTMLGTR